MFFCISYDKTINGQNHNYMEKIYIAGSLRITFENRECKGEMDSVEIPEKRWLG